MRIFITTILMAVLVGCATSEKVDMFKPGTEETRVCGPYGPVFDFPSEAEIMANSQELRGCVMDYQRQGFERK